MPKAIVLSDLDRTLFDTSLFFDQIWTFAADMYFLDADHERSRAPEFYDMHGDSYNYRFFNHMRDAAGAAYDHEAFTEAARRKLSGQFLYPDVTDAVITLLDAIVTFGGSEYQLFKITLCPPIAHLEKHISLLPKGDYIAKTFTQPSVLIDDKPIKHEILPPAHFIRMDRIGAQLPSDDLVIHDFSELSGVLTRLNID